MNIGHSSRIHYDKKYIKDEIFESTQPLMYRLDANNIHNCKACLSTLGPRSGAARGHGVSTLQGNKVATSQSLVDVESVLHNLNYPVSRDRDSQVNPINVTKMGVQHSRVCNDFLNPLSSRLSYPAYNYRELAINRFYDLPKDPQTNIFWNHEVNTTLEAKDNFNERIPNFVVPAELLPKELAGKAKACKVNCGAYCSNDTVAPGYTS
jgi:hypothetical protein